MHLLKFNLYSEVNGTFRPKNTRKSAKFDQKLNLWTNETKLFGVWGEFC